jgi:hypothetical protein
MIITVECTCGAIYTKQHTPYLLLCACERCDPLVMASWAEASLRGTFAQDNTCSPSLSAPEQNEKLPASTLQRQSLCTGTYTFRIVAVVQLLQKGATDDPGVKTPCKTRARDDHQLHASSSYVKGQATHIVRLVGYAGSSGALVYGLDTFTTLKALQWLQPNRNRPPRKTTTK